LVALAEADRVKSELLSYYCDEDWY
jgi:hypothetical protein